MFTALAHPHSRDDPADMSASITRWIEFAYILLLLILSTLGYAGAASTLAACYVAYTVFDLQDGLQIPLRLALGVLPLILLFLLGLPGYLFHIPSDVYRDVWYFLNTIMTFALGYLWYSKNQRVGDLIDLLITVGGVGAVSSIYELYLHWTEVLLLNSLNTYRGIVGFGGVVTVAAIASILICQAAGYTDSLFLRIRWLRYTAMILLFIGVVVCFSRTLYSCLLLCYIISSTRRRLVFRLFWLSILAVGLWSYSLNLGSERGSFLNQFLDKVSNSASEVSTNHFWSNYEINTNWRGYESYRVFDTFEKFDLQRQIFGGGFGQLVDLKLEMQLGPETFTKIPIFHSGYNYVLIKTGVSGILIMLCFFASMVWTSGRSVKASSVEERILARLMLWTIITIIIMQWTTPGMYSKIDISGIFILGLGLKGTADVRTASSQSEWIKA